jgi:cytochrome c-type biogenesis protein CcmF
MANNWIFTAIAFATLWGTFFPMFSEIFTGDKISVAAPFFNKVNGPLFLILFVLMGAGPLLGWRHTSVDAFRKQFTWPLVGALVTAVAAAFVNRNPYPIVGLAVCGFVAATILQEYVRGVRARQAANGENALVAMGNLYRRNGRRYGGYLVHLAMVMIGVAVVGNEFYQQTTHVTLDKGQGVEIAGYELVYTDLVVTEAANRLEFITPIMVYDAESGALLSTLRPQRNVYHKNPEAPTSEVGLRMTLTEDVYVLLNGWEEGATSATFTIYINPLTVWLWIGGVLLSIGTLIAAWPHPARRTLPNEATYGVPVGAQS